MTDYISKQELTNLLGSLLPSSHVIDENTITATSTDLYRLYNEVGDYALKFGKFSTDIEYRSYTMTGAIDLGDGLSGTAGFNFGKYDGLDFQASGSAQVYGLTMQSSTSTDGELASGSGFNFIVVEGGVSGDANGNTTSNVSVNLAAVVLGAAVHKYEDRIVGFTTDAGPAFGKFGNAKFGRTTKVADIAFNLEEKIGFEPEIGGFLSDVDDIYDELKQEFSSIYISENKFYDMIAANMKYGDMASNYDEIEAAGIVVYELLYGEYLEQQGAYSSVGDISQLIQERKLYFEALGEEDSFEGYSAFINTLEEDAAFTPDFISDEAFKELVIEAMENNIEGSRISGAASIDVTFEGSDGSTEIVTLNPTVYKMQKFDAEVSEAINNGTVISQTTEVINNADGSVVNKVTTLVDDGQGNLHEVIQSELADGSIVPVNGFDSTTFVRRTDLLDGSVTGISQKTTFIRNGQKFETEEFQEDPDANWSIKQKITNSDGTISDDSPTFVVPSSELLGSLQFAGGTVGGLLADHLAGDDAFKGIAYGAVLKTIGTHFGTFTAFLAVGGELEAAVRAAFGEQIVGPQTAVITAEFTETLYANLNNGVVMALSNLIVDEVGEALGIDGTIGGEIFDVAAGTVTTGIIQAGLGSIDGLGFLFNGVDTGVYSGLLSGGLNFSSEIFDIRFVDPDFIGPFNPTTPNIHPPNTTVGEVVGLEIANAFAAYAGNRLAGEFIEPESETAAIFGAAGSALGVAIATGAGFTGAIGVSVSSALSTAFSAAGTLAGPIGIAIGAFVGTVVGTFLGNAFGGEDEPWAGATAHYDSGARAYSVSSWGTDDGGDSSIARTMLNQALQGVNNVIQLSQGKLRQSAHAADIQMGYDGDEYFVIMGGQAEKTFVSAADAITYASFKLLKGFDIVGGHAVLMRAWHNSDATNLFEFKEDIEIAEAFQNYLANPTAILALMMNDPESDLAQSWAAILQRAAELELHLPHEKDLDGGWAEILLAQGVDPTQIPSIEGDSIVLTDPVTGEETIVHHVIGPGYEIVRIEGTDGNDIIEVIVDGPSISYVDAGPGDDVVQGSDQADIIIGGAGEDSIYGNGGNDWIHGGDGADLVYGGDGADLIVGGEADDVLVGDDGDDIIHGNGGDDEIYAGSGGNDILIGGAGNDTLHGNGKDAFYYPSLVTTSTLSGGIGDDYLIARHNDILIGGEGNDTFEFTGWGRDNKVIIGLNDGHDQVIATYNEYNTISFSNAISFQELYFQQSGGDLKISILGANQSVTLQNFYAFNDPKINIEAHGGKIIASGKDAILQAVANDLTIAETPVGPYNIVSDAALANAINDVESGGVWVDTVNGWFGWGSDSSTVDTAGVNWVNTGGAGDDYLTATNSNGTKRFYGDSGNDTIIGINLSDLLVGGLGNDNLYGKQGDDQLIGGHGNDYLSGGDQNDSLYGVSGDDQLYGGLGHDLLKGGEGDDYLEDSNGHNDFFGGDGNDVMTAEFNIDRNKFSGGDGNDTITGGVVEDTISGGSGTDIINANAGDDWINGDEGDDVINAGAGDDIVNAGTDDDVVDGGSGNDSIYGEEGNDTLFGGEGDDLLFGGNGDDLLEGGEGQDFLYGGLGDDSYLFDINNDDSIIQDDGGTDTIEVAAGLTFADLSLSRSGDNLIILGSGRTIVIDHFKNGSETVVETLKFDDGSTFDLQSLSLTETNTAAVLSDYTSSVAYYGSTVFADGVDNTSVTDATPNMNSNTLLVQAVTSSGIWSGAFEAWHAFSGSAAGTPWADVQDGNNWISFELTDEKTVTEYTVAARSDNYTHTTTAPKDWTLEASSDGINWTILDTVTDEAGWGLGEVRNYTITNDISFAHYRLNISENNGNSALVVGEIEFKEFGGEDVTPDMTSNALAAGTANSSGVWSGAFETWQAFSGSVSGSPWADVFDGNNWIGYEFTDAKIINKYTVSARADNSSYATTAPKDWQFEGSNDGVTWTVLSAVTDQIDWTLGETRTFATVNGEEFTHYRLNVSDNNGDTALAIGEIDFIETEAIDELQIDASITLGDIDSIVLSGAEIRMTGHFDGFNNEVLNVVTHGGIAAVYTDDGAGDYILSLSGDASVSEYELTLESLTYRNTSASLTVGNRTLEITVIDDTGEISALHNTVIDVRGNQQTVISDYASSVSYYGSTIFADGSENTSALDATPTMSSDTLLVQAVTSSGIWSGAFEAWHAFSGSAAGTPWADVKDGNNWIAFELTGDKTITEYTVAARSDNYTHTTTAPKDWTLQASSDGINWTVLDTVAGESGWGLGEARNFSITNNESFAHYRLNILENNGNSALVVGEIEFREASGTDVTPDMTSNSLIAGSVSASGVWNSSFGAWHAFSGSAAGTPWADAFDGNNWIDYEFADAKVINKYTVAARSDNYTHTTTAPKDWTLEGSNDGVTWFVLDTVAGETGWGLGESRTFTTVNTEAFTHYRINISDNNGNSALVVGEIDLIEAEAIDEIKIDTDITLSDVDSLVLAGAEVKMTGHFDGIIHEILSVTVQAGITASYTDDGVGGYVLTLSGEASLNDYEIALESLTYSNTSSALTIGDRTLEITVTDDTGEVSTVHQATISVGGDFSIIGSDGDDVLYGTNAADALLGGVGSDTLYGGLGADTFVIDAIASGDLNTIKDIDFVEGDVIDISTVLSNYDPLTDALTDFVEMLDDGSDTYISIDQDGLGTDATMVASIMIEDYTGHGNSIENMINEGKIIL